MEYVVGSIITLATIIIAKLFLKKEINSRSSSRIRHSQSHIVNMIWESYEYQDKPQSKNTQSRRFIDKNFTKVLIVKDEAYWITDNAVYVADIEDGEPVSDSARVVDTMGMNDVQLKKIMFVVKTLTEGEGNDSWNSGKS